MTEMNQMYSLKLIFKNSHQLYPNVIDFSNTSEVKGNHEINRI
jgi:hypothetical protein